MRRIFIFVKSELGDTTFFPLLIVTLMLVSWQPLNAFGYNIPFHRITTDAQDFTEVTFYAAENSETNTVVGALKDHLSFLRNGDDLRFQIHNLGFISDSKQDPLSFQQSGNESDSMFRIDPISSTIFVADSLKLDRERLCPFASGTDKPCSLTYGVAVIRMNKSAPPLSPEQSWIKLKIVVNDVNDCAPQFNFNSVHGCKAVNFPEDTAVGTKVVLPDAADLDSLQHGQLIYHLNCQNRPTNHPFALYESKSAVAEGDGAGSSLISLQLRYPLDYEEQTSYNCTLSACDNGMPVLCSTISLCITVHDVNDNAPVFSNENSSLILREDTPVGSRVTKLNASDADSGAFGSIQYALVGDLPGFDGSQRHFRVDANTGELFVISSLKGGTKFHFWVEARDYGEPESKMSRTTLSIYISDVNNHAPKISVLPAAMKIKSPDSTDGSRLSVLSRVIKVPCSFAGVRNSKVCEESGGESSLIQIFEDNVAPTSIAFIRVFDSDVGENAQVDCRLITQPGVPYSESFGLVQEHKISTSNVVYKLVLETMLDCEIHSHAKGRSICNSAWTIPMRIECRDFGEPVRTTVYNMFVEILDNNEFPPVFEKEVYRVEVKENIPTGSNVIQISITDSDSTLEGVPLPEYQNLKQALIFELDMKEGFPFAIDSSSGRIYTTGQLDAENIKEFTFKVKAINRGLDNVTLTSICQVVVGVQNVNDNPPRFLTPRVLVGSLSVPEGGTAGEDGRATTVVRIPENLHKGTVFMQLTTHDPDGNANATIRLKDCVVRKGPMLSEVGKNVATRLATQPRQVFDVDPTSGKCWTTGNLDRETEPAYLCTLVAEDGEISSRLSSTTTLVIEVVDENDNAPLWLYPRSPDDSRIQIGVDFPTSRIITRVRAVDADSGKNARISYSLEDVSFVHFNHDRSCDLKSLFFLESTSGHLRMQEGIKTCLKPGDSVRLQLRATDGGTPPQSKDAEFFLEIKTGSEVLNIPPESTFLTQADEAFGNKPPNSESHLHEILAHSDAFNSFSVDNEGDTVSSGKRMQLFVLMIAVPLAAILLCCCLIATLLFVMRSRRRHRPHRGNFKESYSMNELEVDATKQMYSSFCARTSHTKSPTLSFSRDFLATDLCSIASQSRTRPCSSHEVAQIPTDDSASKHSGEIQLDSQLVYSVYLKALDKEPIPSTSTGETLIRLSSIPETEGTILVPLSKKNVVPCTIAVSAVNPQKVPGNVSYLVSFHSGQGVSCHPP